MAVHEFKERIVLASAMVQCLLHGATDEDDSNLGYPDHLLRIRLSLDMITSAFIQCLVVGAGIRNTGSYLMVFVPDMEVPSTVEEEDVCRFCGLVCYLLHDGIDGGLLFTIFLLIDLELRIHIIRSLLPQMAGLASTCILYQETLGKAARDIGAAACDPRDEINATPVLDTIFSTPGVSLQARETLTRITNSEQDLTSIDLEYNNDSHINGGGRDSGLLGAVSTRYLGVIRVSV
ncbi:hypothetical protein MD484_g7617, partial [Candolleomyces efflorescens]